MGWTDFIVPIDHGYKERAMESLWAAELAYYQPNTLCELCEKACGFCSWSREFRPVEGWEAIRSDIVERDSASDRRMKVRVSESYIVVSCPEFLLTPRCEEFYRKWNRQAAVKHLSARKILTTYDIQGAMD